MTTKARRELRVRLRQLGACEDTLDTVMDWVETQPAYCTLQDLWNRCTMVWWLCWLANNHRSRQSKAKRGPELYYRWFALDATGATGVRSLSPNAWKILRYRSKKGRR